MTIDGFSESGAVRNTLLQGNNASLQIILDGAVLDGTGVFGFDVQADYVTIRGLRLTEWGNASGGGAIITSATADHLTVAGNFIGNAAGDLSGRYGILLDGNNHTIGGTSVADRNTISGTDSAIIVAGGSGTVIAGNTIGLTPDRTSILANGSDGVWVQSGATDVTIGGTTAVTRNVISGNNAAGVLIDGSSDNRVIGNIVDSNQHGVIVTGAGATGNVITGNLIGLGGANDDGIQLIGGSSNTTIGGVSTADRNVISGNGGDGILINVSDANTIIGNFIGTNVAGTAAQPNAYGMRLYFTTGNTIGGGLQGEGNLVAGGIVLQNDVFDSVVQGNIVGWDVTGTVALGGSISVVSGSGNIIGTDGDGENDASEGNQSRGMSLSSGGNIVAGNLISIASDGVTAGGDVLLIDAGGNRIGSNSDGMSDEEERNIIRGIWVRNVSIVPNEIVGNYIGTNVAGDAQIIGGGFGIRQTNSIGATLIKDNLISGNVSVGLGSSASTGIAYGAEAWFEAEDATDSFGSHDGLLVGGATVAAGIDGQAFSLDGIDDYVSVASAPELDLSGGEFTIEGWINPDASGDGNLHTIVNKSTANIDIDYRLAIHTDGRLRVDVGGLGNTVFSDRTVPTGQWTHVASVQNTDTGEIRLYINGAVVGAGNVGASATSTANLLIGAHDNTLGLNTEVELFDGLIDDVGIYSRALDAAEILAIANAQGLNKQGGLIVGNTIGMGTDGDKIPNGNGTGWHAGASIGGVGVVVGGEDPRLRNIITGNTANNNLLLRGGTGYHVVAGNYIGVAADGVTTFGNNADGIEILDGSNNNIIGGNRLLGNVISGNRTGLAINSSTNTFVAGNLFGTNPAGTQSLPNGSGGAISISAAAANVTIGTNNDGINDGNEFNVISGNNGNGILTASAGVTIAGNLIGTDVSGTLPLANTGTGIRATAGSVTIGGVGLGNVITKNAVGINVESAATATITGNWIGTGTSGLFDFGNAGAGIQASGNAVIGGIAPGEGNVIAFNNVGVIVAGATTTASIRGNSLYDNTGLGIDLANTAGIADGTTPNDVADGDSGPNGLQNFPDLSGAASGATTEITGTFAGLSGVSYDLDFYASDAADTSGNGEGRRYLGTWTVTGTGAAAPFTADVGFTLNQEIVTATATRAGVATSEFSGAITAASEIQPAIKEGSLIVTVVDEDNELETFGDPKSEVAEGTKVRLDGQFEVPNPGQTVTIAWGDGTTSETDAVDVQDNGFTAEHTYLDDLPSGTAQDDYTIRVIVTDSSTGASGSAARPLTVANVEAKFDGPLVMTPGTVSEGASATLTGTIADPGINDIHRLLINWGDGSPVQLKVLTRGQRQFAIPHPFRDNNPAPITVTLLDDDSGSVTATTTATVTNLPPIGSIIGPVSGVEGTTSRFTAVGTDPGVADIPDLSYQWKVFAIGGGQVAQADGPTLDFTPVDQGNFEIRLITRDGDGGQHITSQTFVAENAEPVLLLGTIFTDDPTGPPVSEGDTITLRGDFSDAGLNDSTSRHD